MNENIVQIKAQLAEIDRVIKSLEWTYFTKINETFCYCDGYDDLTALTKVILKELKTAKLKCACKCPECSEMLENCECEKCEECEELIENCECKRCPECSEILENCNCEN